VLLKMDPSNMKATKMTKANKHSFKVLPSERNVCYQAQRKKSSSAYIYQNLGTNKKLRKQKFLLQLAVLGFVTWGIIVFVSHVIDDHNKSVYQEHPKLTEFIALSDLRVLKDDSVTSHSSEQHTTANTEELRLRLQSLRMHNVLRASNSSQILRIDDSTKAEYKTNVSSVTNADTNNLQRELVQKWEKEFLALQKSM
jgi:hypothetical protein